MGYMLGAKEKTSRTKKNKRTHHFQSSKENIRRLTMYKTIEGITREIRHGRKHAERKLFSKGAEDIKEPNVRRNTQLTKVAQGKK
jgi:hypothetical protein